MKPPHFCVNCIHESFLFNLRSMYNSKKDTISMEAVSNYDQYIPPICLIVDEAHKATGRYPYVTVVEQISKATFNTRIIGLSASPGSTINAVQEVIDNLYITHLEVRTLDSPDVSPYLHEKTEKKVIVKLTGEISILAEQINKLL